MATYAYFTSDRERGVVSDYADAHGLAVDEWVEDPPAPGRSRKLGAAGRRLRARLVAGDQVLVPRVESLAEDPDDLLRLLRLVGRRDVVLHVAATPWWRDRTKMVPMQIGPELAGHTLKAAVVATDWDGRARRRATERRRRQKIDS